jgi:RimJ/RimL family protein N-acetyltransferase
VAGPATLRTDRLLLRNWSDADAVPFAAMNADPLVMEHFPNALTPQESLEMMGRMQEAISRDGYGFWAVEVLESGLLAGFVGLQRVTNPALAFAPALEVGWRLDPGSWGRGIATEAATAASALAFTTLGVDEILAYTAARNERSRRVMERLGMVRDAGDDFLFPSLAADDPIAPHVVYRLGRERWSQCRSRRAR